MKTIVPYNWNGTKIFLFQQDDFLWAKYLFYDAYCEEIKTRSSYKTCSQILESLARMENSTLLLYKYAIQWNSVM